MSKVKDYHLLETRNNLLNEIDGLAHEEMNYHSGENRWSIAQICNHLALSEETFAKAIAYGIKKSNISAEPKNIEYLLDRSIKLEAPEIVMPQIESAETHEIIDQLDTSRNLLNNILSSVEDRLIFAEKSVKHPYLGDLPLYQWIELIYLHEQRHIEQIKEIKSLYQTIR